MDTAARDAVLKNKKSSYAAIRYEKVNKMTRGGLRTYMADKSLVYIYHNVIDRTGEHNEGKVFEAAQSAVDEILLLIRKLYNSLQISNFYVTADHGFLYRENEVEESRKYSNVVSLHPVEASKRYLLTDDKSLAVPYTVEFTLETVSGGAYKIISPYGYDLFKTQGGGLQYVHGGAPLQEIIVPVIHLVAASKSDDVDSRSTRIRFNLRNIEFDRSKRYYLILRNAARPDAYMEREPFTIDIPQSKMF